MNAPFEREYTSTLTPEQGALYPKNSTTTPAETTETTENPTIERGYDSYPDAIQQTAEVTTQSGETLISFRDETYPLVHRMIADLAFAQDKAAAAQAAITSITRGTDPETAKRIFIDAKQTASRAQLYEKHLRDFVAIQIQDGYLIDPSKLQKVEDIVEAPSRYVEESLIDFRINGKDPEVFTEITEPPIDEFVPVPGVNMTEFAIHPEHISEISRHEMDTDQREIERKLQLISGMGDISLSQAGVALEWPVIVSGEITLQPGETTRVLPSIEVE